jgi:nitrite reductase/ring-hydroxylating ferredoxin subunit
MIDHTHGSSPVFPVSEPFMQFNPHWYVVGQAKDFPINQPKKITLNGSPIAVWRDSSDNYAAISDICPHRGASLSHGRIDPQSKCVVCPYHTFKYNDKGRMVQTPGQKTMRSNDAYNFRADVPHYAITRKDEWIYMLNKPLIDINDIQRWIGNVSPEQSIWIEPEAQDNSFRCVTLSKIFEQDARTVTENSLDILHISEVHSFGNKQRPLPISERLEHLGPGRHRYTYEYEAGEDSIPSKLFGIKTLTVENEYVLPHTTIARVKFGKFINTVVTSASPITHDTTKLFVKAYRNNWVFNTPFVDDAFDKITENMMEKTLCEDKGVVDTIYTKYRDGNFITKYDDLVRLYRDDYARCNTNLFTSPDTSMKNT